MGDEKLVDIVVENGKGLIVIGVKGLKDTLYFPIDN